MSRMEELLSDILDELRSIKEDIAEVRDVLPLIRQTQDPDDHYDRLEDLISAVSELGDRLTGGAAGSGGANLEDVRDGLISLENTIDLKD